MNERITYLTTRGRKHRRRSEKVSFSRAAPSPRTEQRLLALSGAGLFFVLLTGLSLWGDAPWSLLGGYALLSIAAFVLYGRDKAAARQGRWRTAESTLHLLGLAGGWPGALVAQRVFRHKAQDPPCLSPINLKALSYQVADHVDS